MGISKMSERKLNNSKNENAQGIPGSLMDFSEVTDLEESQEVSLVPEGLLESSRGTVPSGIRKRKPSRPRMSASTKKRNKQTAQNSSQDSQVVMKSRMSQEVPKVTKTVQTNTDTSQRESPPINQPILFEQHHSLQASQEGFISGVISLPSSSGSMIEQRVLIRLCPNLEQTEDTTTATKEATRKEELVSDETPKSTVPIETSPRLTSESRTVSSDHAPKNTIDMTTKSCTESGRETLRCDVKSSADQTNEDIVESGTSLMIPMETKTRLLQYLKNRKQASSPSSNSPKEASLSSQPEYNKPLEPTRSSGLVGSEGVLPVSVERIKVDPEHRTTRSPQVAHDKNISKILVSPTYDDEPVSSPVYTTFSSVTQKSAPPAYVSSSSMGGFQSQGFPQRTVQTVSPLVLGAGSGTVEPDADSSEVVVLNPNTLLHTRKKRSLSDPPKPSELTCISPKHVLTPPPKKRRLGTSEEPFEMFTEPPPAQIFPALELERPTSLSADYPPLPSNLFTATVACPTGERVRVPCTAFRDINGTLLLRPLQQVVPQLERILGFGEDAAMRTSTDVPSNLYPDYTRNMYSGLANYAPLLTPANTPYATLTFVPPQLACTPTDLLRFFPNTYASNLVTSQSMVNLQTTNTSLSSKEELRKFIQQRRSLEQTKPGTNPSEQTYTRTEDIPLDLSRKLEVTKAIKVEQRDRYHPPVSPGPLIIDENASSSTNNSDSQEFIPSLSEKSDKSVTRKNYEKEKRKSLSVPPSLISNEESRRRLNSELLLPVTHSSSKCVVCNLTFSCKSSRLQHYQSLDHLNGLVRVGLLSETLMKNLRRGGLPLAELICPDTGSIIPSVLSDYMSQHSDPHCYWSQQPNVVEEVSE